MSATHPRLKKSIQEKEKAKMNQQLQEYIKKEKDKPLRSLEEWGEELKSQSKDTDLIIYKDGVGYKNEVAVVAETKDEYKLQEDKPCSIETFKDATKQVKCEAQRKPRTYRPKVKEQVAVPIQPQVTTIDYMNLEYMAETKVIIAKHINYDYYKIPIEWEQEDINITDRKLYYKGMLVDCKATNQPKDKNTPIEIFVDFKISDYSYYFQQPTM